MNYPVFSALLFQKEKEENPVGNPSIFLRQRGVSSHVTGFRLRSRCGISNPSRSFAHYPGVPVSVFVEGVGGWQGDSMIRRRGVKWVACPSMEM